MKIRAGIVALSIALAPHIAAASSEEKEKAVIAALHLSTFDTMPANERLGLAEAALAYWRDFDSRVPRNTPAEAEWLKGELNTSDSNRITRAINSPAYGLHSLVGFTENCVGIFERLVGTVGRNKTVELYLWLKATQCYSDRDIPFYLRTTKLSDGKDDGAFKMETFSMMRSAITGKLANALINE